MSTSHPLPSRARAVFRVNRSLWLLFPVAGLILAVTALVAGETLLGALVALAAIGVSWAWWWWTAALFRSYRWQVDDQTVQMRGGVVFRSHAVLPRARVQNVTATTGPLQRRRTLTTLTVHSAGAHTPDIVIPHLDDEDAARVRSSLLPSDSAIADVR